jgi:uroporphyrinogen-III decarboxylase
MLIQYDLPHLFHAILQRKVAQLKPLISAWAAVGVHGIFAEEVWTGADIISSQSYENFVFPYNQDVFRHASAAGLHTIHYVCGNVMPRLQRIAQLGVSAIAVEESKKGFCIEIEEVVKCIGEQCAVFGNIDAVQYGIQASDAALKAEVRRQARAGLGAKGFIASTGSPFPLDTNPRRIDTLVAAAHACTPNLRNRAL